MANFLIVGDAPNTHSGLSRIAKDIAQHLVKDGHQVTFLGLAWSWGWTRETDPGYPIFAIRDGEEFGERDVLEHVYRLHPQTLACSTYPDRPLIVFFIWDPSRCASPIAALRAEQARGNFKNVEIWGYYAVDAEGPGKDGAFAGPAAMAVDETDRVLAYTEFGQRVLNATRKRPGVKIEHLPHGLSAPFVEFNNQGLRVLPVEINKWASLHYGRILGAVATNQPRKDLPLLFEAGARARDSGLIDALWLHTDLLFGHYALPFIVESFGWVPGENLLITTPRGIVDKKTGFGSRWTLSTDAELAAMYQACRVTFAPGLGEGWGYPIVESLALGVPCVGVDYAGGAELLPETWRIEPDSFRWDGNYCLRRPVMGTHEFMRAFRAAIGDIEGKHEDPQEWGQKWAWSKIWPELWRPWVEAGLK